MSDWPYLDSAPVCRNCVTEVDERFYLAMPEHGVACVRCGKRAHLAIGTDPASTIGGALRAILRRVVRAVASR